MTNAVGVDTRVTELFITGKSEALPDFSDAMDKFVNLQSLRIAQSNFRYVERSRIAAFKRIEKLDFLYNKMDELAADTFDDLKNLTKLSIYSNDNLKEIHGQLLKELRNLKEIYLYRNRIEILAKDLFRNNEKLEKIHIAGNNIKVLHRDLFVEQRNLRWLDLSGNIIEILPEGLFRNNQKLEEINFFNNQIKTIETDFQNLSRLSFIDLEDNVCIDELCDKQFCGTGSISEMQKMFEKKCPK